MDLEKMKKLEKLNRTSLHNLLIKNLSNLEKIEVWPGWSEGYAINNKIYIDKHLEDGKVVVALIRSENVKRKNRVIVIYLIDYKRKAKFDVKELGNRFNEIFEVDGDKLKKR
jgi:hypothetical protein